MILIKEIQGKYTAETYDNKSSNMHLSAIYAGTNEL
jgi:hypothetical protein